MKRILNLIRLRWLPLSALLLTAITMLSLWPQAALPDVPGGDKVHHYIAYAALIFPAALCKPDKWLWIGLLFFGWSGAIELVQPYVQRYGEWADLAANGAGLISGLIIARLLDYLYRVEPRI